MNKIIIKMENGEVEAFRVKNDVNGNPRYVVSFMSVGTRYNEPLYNKVGFSKYRGKEFGGGLVFTSYSLEDDFNRMVRRYKELKGEA